MDECVTKVALHISCQGLSRSDLLSKSDPLCAVYIENENWREKCLEQWAEPEYDRTEVVGNNLNPEFARTIKMDYHFETVQKLKFVVFDVDHVTALVIEGEELGSLECTLGQIVSRKSYTEKLSGGWGQNAGTITIVAEEVNESNEVVQLTFHGKQLDKKDLLGKSDPYLIISKELPDGGPVKVLTTEVCICTLNPSWDMIEIPLDELCNCDYDMKLKFDCFDWDNDTEHDFIGSFKTTLRELEPAKHREMSFPLINEKKKQKKKKYENSGVLYLSSFSVRTVYTFLEYIMGGCQVNFSVGIDFTQSNGDPKDESSLHFINPYSPNEYQQALVAVGSVCQDYDTDKLFPAYGFGAKLPNGQVSHDFPLNFNPDNPYCQEITGVVAAYQNAIRSVKLYGPTNVAPIINHVAGNASKAVGASPYSVLLLLTDGILSDMPETVDALVHASRLPMSVIIVGVGKADFSDMNALDCDEGFLTSPRCGSATRDIVQFVPFRDFKQDPVSLAKAVLAEVPKQAVEYFKTAGITPGNV